MKAPIANRNGTSRLTIAVATASLLPLLVSLFAENVIQQPQQIRLAPPDAQLRDEFTQITSVRELRDGRALITDSRENRLVVADLRVGTTVPVGRRGQGPLEYAKVSPLWGLAGDTSMMEAGDERVLVLVGARIVASWSDDTIPIRVLDRRQVQGLDSMGHALTSATRGPLVRSALKYDTTWFVRYERASEKPDTLAIGIQHKIGFNIAPTGRATGGGGVGGPPTSTTPRRHSALLEYDIATMFADGWVAIVRFDPYHVEWCSPAPSRRCTSGPVIESRPSFTNAEKRAYVKMWVEDRGWSDDLERYTDWPPTIPPFVFNADATATGPVSSVLPIPDGRLLIERVRTIGRPAISYDIIDRRGIRVATLSLPRSQRIVAFGRGTVYTVTTDANDLQHLQRHRW